MRVYDMEIGWAVHTQIIFLCNLLRRLPKKPKNLPLIIHTTMPSAPHDDNLFDSLKLFVNIDEDGSSNLRGTITKWSPATGDTYYHYQIKLFNSLSELIEWLDHTGEAHKFCTNVMLGKADEVLKEQDTLV